MTEPNRWQIAWPAHTNGSDARSASALLAAVAQFDVLGAVRYQAGGGATWCNIFLWDVTRALACEVPHWLYGEELSANAVVDWLSDARGREAGWREVSEAVARSLASGGFPTVLAWKNPNPAHHGHVAVMLPDGTIAQAGVHNFFGVPVAAGFGNLVPRYFTHD